MRQSVRFVVMLIVAALAPVQAARYALLVGSSRGGSSDVPLKYVTNDLNRMRSVLVGVCGFSASNVTTLNEPTPTSVHGAFEAVRDRLQRGDGDDLFLLYYTGHADGGALRLNQQRLQFDKLWDELVACPARIKVAVFDACQSGSFARMKGGKLAEPFLFASDAKVEGVVVLSSSSANENSQESDALRSSVFTFHVVNALRGSADASGDGRVTLNEAYQYSYNRTVTSTMHSSGGVQHPGYRFEIKGEGDVVLADLNLHTGGILLAADVEGDITIVDDSRTVVAELSKKRGSPMAIAVADGTYEVIARRADASMTAECTVDANAYVTIEDDDLEPLRMGRHPTRGKGSAGADSYIGFTFAAGYSYVPQDALNDVLGGQGAAFGAYGLDVEPAVQPHLVRGGLGFEWWIAGRVLLGFELNYGGTSSEGAAVSSTVNPNDNLTYSYEVTWRTLLELYSMTPSIGFRLTRGPLRNLGFRLAVDIHHVEYLMDVGFEDGLYDLRTSKRTADDGALAVPSITATYAYDVRPWLDIGLAARYRYQRRARKLSDGPFAYGGGADEEASDAFKYDLEGFDVRVFVSFNVGKDED